jgi:RNA polymerase sigma factor (sigma-70 family)
MPWGVTFFIFFSINFLGIIVKLNKNALIGEHVTDEEVMRSVKSGNVKMLAILFERYHVKLYNYFLRLAGNKSVSEDLTQEVFLRILKYRDTFRYESKFTTWMYQIGRNVHIDYLRKYKKEMPLEEKWEEEVAADTQPEQKTLEEQDMVFLHKALSQLTPAKKEVLVLSRFQGMKYREISQLLGCSLSTVKVQVHRAIKDLRKTYLSLKGGTA